MVLQGTGVIHHLGERGTPLRSGLSLSSALRHSSEQSTFSYVLRGGFDEFSLQGWLFPFFRAVLGGIHPILPSLLYPEALRISAGTC